jgi:hypothetical protein
MLKYEGTTLIKRRAVLRQSVRVNIIRNCSPRNSGNIPTEHVCRNSEVRKLEPSRADSFRNVHFFL